MFRSLRYRIEGLLERVPHPLPTSGPLPIVPKPTMSSHLRRTPRRTSLAVRANGTYLKLRALRVGQLKSAPPSERPKR